MWKTPGKGILTFAFDDGYLDTYKYAITYLDKLGIKSTIALPSSFIGKKFENRPVVGIDKLKSCIKFGHEIASHTINHPNLFRLNKKNKKAVIHEITQSKYEIYALLNYRVSSFVFPYINKNQSKPLRNKARFFYKSARITSGKPSFNKLPIKDPYSLVGFAVKKNHSFSYLNNLIDHAQKKNLWLIEVFHLVGKKNTPSAHRSKPYRFFTHIDDFKKHVHYALSKNIKIMPQKNALSYAI